MTEPLKLSSDPYIAVAQLLRMLDKERDWRPFAINVLYGFTIGFIVTYIPLAIYLS